MTEEELKNKLVSEAQASWNKLNITKRVCGSEFSYYDGYVDCGTIKEKQIQIDAEQIRALQKQNGELTDKVKELEKNIELENKLCNVANNLLENWCRNKEDYCPHLAKLEAQIEQTKCCGNCLYQGECDLSGYEECKNFDKWELRR